MSGPGRRGGLGGVPSVGGGRAGAGRGSLAVSPHARHAHQQVLPPPIEGLLVRHHATTCHAQRGCGVALRAAGDRHGTPATNAKLRPTRCWAAMTDARYSAMNAVGSRLALAAMMLHQAPCSASARPTEQAAEGADQPFDRSPLATPGRIFDVVHQPMALHVLGAAQAHGAR